MARFSDIKEQQAIKNHLQHALETGRISHAYLISGEEGMGKKMIARTFAQAVLCEDLQMTDGKPEPCGVCPSCVRVQAGTHPDLREVVREKAHISVDEIRIQLVQDVALKPMSGSRRVYIIPEADEMAAPAQNALLKTLEEPPAYALILLLAVRPGALLPTILSRTVELSLKPVSDEGVARYLMENHQIPDYRARECAACAEGNIGKAIRYAGDDAFRYMVEKTARLLQEMGRLNSAQIMERLGEILLSSPEDQGGSIKRSGFKDVGEQALMSFFDLLTVLNRDAMVYKAGEPDRLVFAEQEAYDKEAAARSWRRLYENNKNIDEARERIRANVNTDMTLELLFLDMKKQL